jgi:hypothetical protein
MKRVIFIALAMALPFSLIAKKSSLDVEVKEGDGVKAHLTPYDGVPPTSKYTHIFPYVCYEKRIKIKVAGEMLLKYKECFRTNASCKKIGRAHFGKYPNDFESYKALNRCINAKPKFVD